MGQALYRKYRPRSFSEVVGQEAIVKTLQNAIKSGRINHAYLFSGPKGVGKTSVARILAHEVNKLPYSDESIHLDIIEIDGASNRRIDEIRDLRDKVNIAPTSAKYKVYIIDEVHMLTKEAFNALLKTLEEPPAHCIFILATTEAHKLPETIISRTQHFNFKPVSPQTAAGHLGAVAKHEKISIDREALEMLAEAGGGSFRDSLGLLDQLSHADKKVTPDMVREMTGLAPTEQIEQARRAVDEADLKAVIEWVQQVRSSAVSPARLSAQLADNLREDLVRGQSSPWMTRLLKDLLEVNGAKQPIESLEIALLEAANRTTDLPEDQPSSLTDTPDTSDSQPASEPEPPVESEPEPEEEVDEPQTSTRRGFSLNRWPEIVELTRSTPGGLHSALRLSRPGLAEDRLELTFDFPLHQKKVAKAENIRIIGDLIEQLTGDRIQIECLVDRQPAKAKASPPPADDKTSELQTISSIFGSAEVIES